MKTLLEKYKDINAPLSIEVDDLVHEWNPLTAKDYSSRYILSAIYEPLINGYNCEIQVDKCNYLVSIYDNYIGTPVEVKNSIEFHLFSNISPYRSCFLAIKNASKILRGTNSREEIGIKVIDNNKLIIKLERETEDFLSILQSFFLIPSKNNKPLQNGPYCIEEKNDESIVICKNPYYTFVNFNNIERIIFILNRNTLDSLNMYLDGVFDITCHTQFLHQNLKYKDTLDFNSKNIKLLYYINIQNPNLKINLSENFKADVSSKLNGIIYPTNNLLTVQNNSLESNITSIKFNKVTDLKLVYADYYPNDFIVESIQNEFRKHGYLISLVPIKKFSDFLKIDIGSYDMILELVFPPYEHSFSLLRYFVAELTIERKEQIIELFNNRQTDGLYKILDKTSKSIPLFIGRALYFKNPRIRGYHISEDGLLNLTNISINKHNEEE